VSVPSAEALRLIVGRAFPFAHHWGCRGRLGRLWQPASAGLVAERAKRKGGRSGAVDGVVHITRDSTLRSAGGCNRALMASRWSAKKPADAGCSQRCPPDTPLAHVCSLRRQALRRRMRASLRRGFSRQPLWPPVLRIVYNTINRPPP
jgi:hypothetical protein